jgi:DNA-directed RNA polymerase beta' subunit
MNLDAPIPSFESGDFDHGKGAGNDDEALPEFPETPVPRLVTRRRPYKSVLGPNVYEKQSQSDAVSGETVSERLRDIDETRNAIAEADFASYERDIKSGSIFKQQRLQARNSSSFVGTSEPLLASVIDITSAASAPGEQSRVKGYSFGMLSEEDVIAQSAVEIKTDKAFEPKSTKIMANGVIDQRMGPSDTNKTEPCPTCGGYLGVDHSMSAATETYACQGHFGHFYGNALFQPTQFTHTLALLRCVCVHCGHFPSDRAKTQRIIDQVLECSPDGTPLNRLQRIRLLAKHLAKEQECHRCRETIRCGECQAEASPCKACSKEKEMRPKIVRGECTTFPYHLVWKAKKTVQNIERVEKNLTAYKQRHNMTDNDYTLNPELARFLLLSLKPEYHVLLSEQLPKGPFRPASYSQLPLERVYGKQSSNKKMLEVSADYIGFIQSIVPRVIPFLPTMDRNGRSDADGTESLHEQTQRLAAVVKQRNQINTMAATESETVLRRLNDQRNRQADDAQTPRPPPIVDMTDADKGNLLRYRRGVQWHSRGQVVDQPLIALAYADYQLLYTLWMAPHLAKQWRSVHSKIKMPNSARDGASRTKDRPQAPTTLQDNKPGRFRGNLTGKRVDFSSRDVITADPLLDIDQIGIPYSVAATLTVPEILSSYNFERVMREAQARVDRSDPDIMRMPEEPQLYLWNAAKTRKVDIMKFRGPNNERKLVSDHPYARELGATIDRPLRDGDIVSFNRAPSLHRGSFMAMYVVLTVNSTFTFNPTIAALFNADYDGDEMNVHVAQDIVTNGEIQVLMPPSANLVLSRNSSPHAGLMQDFLLGAWRLSAKDCFFNMDQAFAMLFNGEMTSRNPPNDDPHDDKKNRYYIAPRIDGVSCLGCVQCLESCRDCASPEQRCVSCRSEPRCDGSRFKNNQLIDASQTWFPQPCVMARCRGCPKCVVPLECAMCVDDETPCDVCAATAPVKIMCDGSGWIKRWSGKQMASFALPTWLNSQTTRSPNDNDLNFHVEHKEEIGDMLTPDEAEQIHKDKVDRRRGDFKKKGEPVFIRKGEFLTGTFNKATVGATTEGVIQQILASTSAPSGLDSVGMFADRNRNAVRMFLRTLGRMGLYILDNLGFSIGPDDMMAQTEKVKVLVQLALYGCEREPPPAKTPEMSAQQHRTALKKDDPIKYGFPRFDVVAHDRRAVPLAVLKKFEIPHKVNQPGIERMVAKLIQDHYKSEAAIGEGKITSVEQTYDVVTRVDRLEARIQSVQRVIVQRATTVFMAAMSYNNGQYAMYIAGTKGNESNISSCGVAVGGQDFSGKRLTNQSIKSYNVTDDAEVDSGDHLARPSANSLYHRLLFHRPFGYAGAEAGAFIYSSYIHGLSAFELFVHAMAGREGLIDTANKTGESGYLQRKMIKTFEAMQRGADGTVRDDAKRIISMPSAGYPFSQQFLRSIKFEPLELDDKTFRECGLLSPSADTVLIQLRSNDVATANRLVAQESEQAFETVRAIREMLDFNQEGPVLRVIGDLSAIIRDAMIDTGHGDKATTGLLPYKMSVLGKWNLDAVYKKWTDEPEDSTNLLASWYFASTVGVVDRNDTPMTVEYAIQRVARWLDTDLAGFDYITRATVFLRLTSKQILLRHQLTVNALELVIERYNRCLHMCRSAPGEPTGIESGQAIGEPATQMTLKTFHTAGRGNKLVYAGIPRIKEVADCTHISSMKCPIIKTRILPDISARDIINTTNMLSMFVHMRLDGKELANNREKLFGDGAMQPAIENYVRSTDELSAELVDSVRVLHSKYARALTGKRSKASSATADKTAAAKAMSEAITTYNAKIHQATNNFIGRVTSSLGTIGCLTLDNAFTDWTTGNIDSAAKNMGVREIDEVCVQALFRGAVDAQKSLWLFCRVAPQLLEFINTRGESVLRLAHIEAIRISFCETIISVITEKNCVIVVPLFSNDVFVGLATIVPKRAPSTMLDVYTTIRKMRRNLPICYNDVAAGRYPQMTSYFADILDRHVGTVVPMVDSIADVVESRGSVEIAPLIRDFRITTIGSIAYSNNTIEFSPLIQTPEGGVRAGNTCLKLVNDMMFENDEEKTIITDEHTMSISDDVGCLNPACAASRKTAVDAEEVESEKLLKEFSYCNDTLCVGSMALVIRIKSEWVNEARFDLSILRHRILQEIGEDCCTVRVYDMRQQAVFCTIVIRVHTCKLDELRQRSYGTSNPALVPVIIQDESMLPAARSLRTAADRAKHRTERFEADRMGTQGETDDPYYLEELRLERGYVESFDFSARVIGLVDRLEQEYTRLAAVHEEARDGTERRQVMEKRNFITRALRESYKYCSDIGVDNKNDIHDAIMGNNSSSGSLVTPPIDAAAFVSHPAGIRFVDTRVRQTRGTIERIADRRRVFTKEFLAKIKEDCERRNIDDVTKMGRTYISEETIAIFDSDPVEERRQIKIKENQANRIRSTARRRKVFDPNLLKEIVRHFAAERLANPLAAATQQELKPVTNELMHEEHMRIRTEIEMFELMRISTHLNSFVFTGERGARIVEKEEIMIDVYTPESGHDRAKQSMAYIDSRSFRSVLSYRGIDVYYTTTTSVRCVNDVLGIEAARNSVIVELWEVLASSVDSTTSNYCNFAHFADVQTFSGDMMPLSRFGIHAHVNDTLQIASNEEQSVQTSAAGIAARTIDEIASPSSAMMLAPHKIGFGTANVELVLDVTKLFEAIVPNDFDTVFDRAFPLSYGNNIAQPLLTPQTARPFTQSLERFAATVLKQTEAVSTAPRQKQSDITATTDANDTAMLKSIRDLKINEAFLNRMEEDVAATSATSVAAQQPIERVRLPGNRVVADVAIPVSQGLSGDAEMIASSRQFTSGLGEGRPIDYARMDEQDEVPIAKARRTQSAFQMAMERQRQAVLDPVEVESDVESEVESDNVEPYVPEESLGPNFRLRPSSTAIVEALVSDEYNPEVPVSLATTAIVMSSLNELQTMLDKGKTLNTGRLGKRDFLNKSFF